MYSDHSGVFIVIIIGFSGVIECYYVTLEAISVTGNQTGFHVCVLALTNLLV